jgi:AcrR family transcriptional regulator
VPTSQITHRPKRADGRRNYDAILTAARAAFADRGTGASLEDVARSAGVAIGTLYGHFPTRENLIEAAVRDGLDTLSARAEELSRADDPLAALIAWIGDAVVHCSTYRGLVGFLAAGTYDQGTPLHHSCVTMHDSGAGLLARAAGAGAVRTDVTADDLFTIITAAAWTRENSPAAGTRLVELVLSGIAA